MTAFYMFRLMGLTFWGSFRGPREVWERVHESPASMTVPLVLLAIPSVLFGMAVGLPLGASTIAGWLEPVFLEATEIGGLHEAQYELFGVDGVLILSSVFVATLGLVLAARLFGWEAGPRVSAQPERVAAITASTSATRFLYRASLNKWWFDDINDLLFMRIGGRMAEAIKWFDERVIDGVVVNGTGRLTVWTGARIRTIQTGRVQNYALGIAIGLLIMAGSFLVIAGRSVGG
jgi:NADH-quinone oxidoreductase subunit L